MARKQAQRKSFKILSLDGGGAKGFYTLGVLAEVEAAVGKPLAEIFDLIYGTSTGSIIGTLLATGMSVEEIHTIYKRVPTVMKQRSRSAKTAALAKIAQEIFKNSGHEALKTGIGIVTTNWQTERPMIFKADVAQAHGREASFIPLFGVKLRDAVQASCSAFPFFELKTVTTAQGHNILLGDGGFCANNPSLYAVADATEAFGIGRKNIALLSIGCGVYPTPIKTITDFSYWSTKLLSVQLLQKVLEVNTQSLEQLGNVLFSDLPMVRINDRFSKPELATDLLEHNLTKLNILRQQGSISYGEREKDVRALLGI
ncbi:Patatin [Mesorhizobium plurifarium]|uniref:Patatin n=1 Tax=Mesorhizobium plurifarium TaxID=69974 RepID=A0A090FBU9_MESPL|nr:Patatin [Mesorhizobium plurifarium]